MYLVNESSKLESVNRVHEIGEKSHSLLDHPRIKLFSCLAQLRLKFILLINVKMPTIVGILTFMSRINYRLW